MPIAAVAFVGSVFFWQYAGIPFLNDIAPAQPAISVRESWVTQPTPAELAEIKAKEAEETATAAEAEQHKTEEPAAREARLLGGVSR